MSSNSFRENLFDWFNRENRVNFTLSQLKMKNQLKKMIEEGDTEIKIIAENDDGSITGSMPLSYLKICKPHKRNLSDDQRKAVADRFRKAKEGSVEK